MKQKAIVIEFAGPPGAGKTTSCRHFAEYLANKGQTVFTLGDLKIYLKELSGLQKVLIAIQALLFRTPVFLHYIIVMAHNGIYSVNSIYRYVRLTIFDITLKKYLNTHNVNVVLLEQWIIQELWSATIFKLKSYEGIKDQLSKFYFKTDYVFYFDIDVATASERIKQRNTNLSRFDSLDDFKRAEQIKKYSTYLFQLYKKSDCPNKYVLQGNKSVQKNSESFFAYLQLESSDSNSIYSLV